ncbi:MAG TPA: ABC transporter ATP-binding protein/permease [Candidatus Nesterenkonia stercoripullorum]|uniref:ABC transporter ATP-binding protein/permease n=1 Tax=Candidatus Nesterenkonia stercoripullorum TaxID=2838701 RepID=A0A9D2A9P1_9MICC|nr:ABC transporter ATP-binding protein/permease [Candidatus Nesterenkonia stercoripullorum]
MSTDHVEVPAEDQGPSPHQAAEAPSLARLPLASGRAVRQAVGAQLHAHRLLTASAVILSALAAAAGLVAPWAIGILVDTVLDGGATSDVVVIALAVAAAGLLSALLTAVSSALVARIGQRVLARMRERVIDDALRLPSGRLEKAGRGDLLSRVGDDVAVVTGVVTGLLAPWAGAALTVGLTIAGLFALNPWLALAGLTAIPIYVFALRWYLPRAAPRYAAERAAFGDRAETLVSSLEGSPTVRAYGVQRRHTAAIEESSDRARSHSRGVLWFSSGWGSWLNIAELVGLASIITVGFFLVSADAATVGAVTAAALYFHRLFNPIGLIIFTFDDIQSALASLERIVGVSAAEPEARAAAVVEAAPAGHLSARGLTHHYGSRIAVQDVSFEVRPGERIALVGSSGAGKSTVAVLLAGLLKPTGGAVLLDGVTVDQHSGTYPRPVVLVTQEAHVFAGPLIEDVRLARTGASDAEVRAALSTVGALDWVERLPEGAHTVVGELGHALTTDQSAHLALARAVLADPAVLILDEATAEADSQHARRLDAAAEAALAGRTGVVVAHRLRQALMADRVLVMEDGAIVESGSHDELLAEDGVYARLWSAYGAGMDAAGAGRGAGAGGVTRRSPSDARPDHRPVAPGPR